MTRQQLDHERYMSNCEQRRARMRAYYQENKEFIKEKRKVFVERRRKDLAMKVIETKVTIKELEERLPPHLHINIPRLRKKFLTIPITERPPYDEYILRIINTGKI